jgi:twinkle protein
MIEEAESTFVSHTPCDACGSRDNNAVYSDGHTYCFGCQAYTPGDGDGDVATSVYTPTVINLLQGEYRALPARG